MTADEQRRLAVVETRVLGIEGDLLEIKGDVKNILATLNQVRGGGKVAMWFAGGGGGLLGAAIMKYAPGLLK